MNAHVTVPDSRRRTPGVRRARFGPSVSLNATPPPQSVSVSLVRLLATLPSGCWWRHQPHGIAARPGRRRAEMRTGSSSVARSLNTRAQSPSAQAARGGVGGIELDERAALGGPVLGQVRVAGVEEARVVLGGHQLEREARRVRAARALRRTAMNVGSAGCPSRASWALTNSTLPDCVGNPPFGPRQAVCGERHLDPAVASQGVEVDGRKRGLEHAQVVVEQQWFGEAHRAGDAPEALAVADRLAERLDRGLVPAHPEMAPRRRDVARPRCGSWPAARCRRTWRCR